ncbi:MAG TPA: DMT family transporter [Acidimicrobiales bacterium]|nr:DMT family transporter [Acidimicrobiales bacterium]
MGIFYGLMAAVLYGTGDYLGGRATANGDVRRVLLVSQATAAVGALTLVLLVSGDATGGSLAYGAAAGVASAAGLGLLYRGLATARAGVVAPLTAVVGALVPVTWGFLRGERPSGVAVAGVALAIAAAALIAREEDDDHDRASGVTLALLAGLFLGASFVCYAATDTTSGMWPVLSARVVAVACAGSSLLLVSSAAVDLPPSTQEGGWARLAIAAGLADVVATVSLVAGVRAELAVLVAAVTALAPGFTVIWAWTLLKERVGRVQAAGVVLALIGLVAIAAG